MIAAPAREVASPTSEPGPSLLRGSPWPARAGYQPAFCARERSEPAWNERAPRALERSGRASDEWAPRALDCSDPAPHERAPRALGRSGRASAEGAPRALDCSDPAPNERAARAREPSGRAAFERPRSRRALGWAVGALAAFTGARGLASPPPVSPPGFARPLSVDALYDPRLRFSGGVPVVSVGVVSRASQVEIRSERPWRMWLDEDGIPKIRNLDGGTRRFRVRSSTPGRRSWWVPVERFSAGEPGEIERSRRRWEGLGHEVRVQQNGSLFAVSGRVLDTRSVEILIGGFSRPEPAENLAQQLFRDQGLSAEVRALLEERPRGIIEVSSEVGVIQLASDGVAASAVGGERLTVNASDGDRSFGGHLYVALDPAGGLAVVHSVDAEELLRGLVPAEIFASAPDAALEAQAIVARGAILSMLGHRHFDVPYHLCDGQHCQVYRSAAAHHPATDRAVRATRGQVAVRPGVDPDAPLELVDSVYSASCGGHSEANEAVWDQQPSPSLRPRLDGPDDHSELEPFRDGLHGANLRRFVKTAPPTYCGRSSFTRPERYRWTQILDGEALAEQGRQLGVGAPTDFEVLGRGPGGRVAALRVRGTDGQVELRRELPIRRQFGLKSGVFVLDLERDDSGRVQRLEFSGAGWGHGVGMCQLGAIGRAEAGHDAARILSHYYSGAVVQSLYE